MSDAETALAALGPLSASNFDQAAKLLQKRKSGLDTIGRIQQNQFYPDAFSLISQVQATTAPSDKIVVISQFLRQFAEYTATQTQILEKTYQDVKSIVDHISPMGGSN